MVAEVVFAFGVFMGIVLTLGLELVALALLFAAGYSWQRPGHGRD